MPRLSVWFIRLALLYLAIGFTFGALMLANKGLDFAPALWRLRPAHIELLLVGWTMQLAMGVAYWILPRFQSSRGDARPVWLALALINLGLLLVSLSVVADLDGWNVVAGRLAELAAVAAFAWHAWPRIKPIGQ
jgi:heme/copper-type cytochrome/quinol oxidase subunit 1